MTGDGIAGSTQNLGEIVLQVGCTTCQMGVGAMCVYTVPQHPHYTEAELRSWPSMRPQFARVGQPTKRCHEARYVAARKKLWMDTERRLREEKLQQQDTVSDDAAAIRQAEYQFIRDEMVALRRWLLQDGHILWG